MLILLTAASVVAWMTLGGSAYEYLVVDPRWPQRRELIQPERGGIVRRRFWMPMHGIFELLLIANLVANWNVPAIRMPLLIALASHGLMRIWSFAYFIPRALAFERSTPDAINVSAAKRWTRMSLARMPLDLVTCGAMIYALTTALSGRP